MLSDIASRSQRRFPFSTLTSAGTVAVMITVMACAASPPRTTSPAGGTPSEPAEGTPASPPSPPTEPEQPPASTPPPPATTGVAPPTKPNGPRLPWVNPARCVASCSFHPGDALQRVNDQGQSDPRGRHRVDATALGSLRDLLAAARAAGHTIRIASAFRSYDEQARVFRTTKERGRAARPGHSEHQLGTTIDLRLPTSLAIAWLAGHAAEHGFALSYPPGKQRITGYRPEPWHVRFVGREIADDLHRRGGTLEEYFRSHPELGESGNCKDCPAPLSRMPCGPTTEAGKCEGTVLTWCYEGALAMVDCAAFSHTCDRPADGGVPDCIPGAAKPSVLEADE